MTVTFLDIDDVVGMHAMELEVSGGSPGLRDRGLLESAVAQPQASAFGDYVHADLVAMATAYLFHIVRNHPFVDENKRAGLLAALVFLDLNGLGVTKGAPGLYELTLGVADGSIGKAEAEAALRRLVVFAG